LWIGRGPTAVLREIDGEQELLIPIAIDGDRTKIDLNYDW
jgi:hypothetical protein